MFMKNIRLENFTLEEISCYEISIQGSDVIELINRITVDESEFTCQIEILEEQLQNAQDELEDAESKRDAFRYALEMLSSTLNQEQLELLDDAPLWVKQIVKESLCS